MKCKQRPTCVWRELDGLRGVAYGATVTIYCITCNDYVPWGPAKDDGEHAEHVAVEIEAARVQTDYHTMSMIMSCPDELLTSPVGQLARAIWEHGKEPSHANWCISVRTDTGACDCDAGSEEDRG